jgi:hypothetical protein
VLRKPHKGGTLKALGKPANEFNIAREVEGTIPVMRTLGKKSE